jgi:hypothetical protein
MIYETPDPWRLERRGPQHAAPFDSSAPLRRHGGRALRLFVTAGAWGAGLCLVIGLVAMVAQGTAPARPRHSGPTAGDVLRGTGYDGYIKQFSSTSRALPWFQVAGHSRWELRWSYHCAAGTRGYLMISELETTAGVSVRATGPTAHGVTWTFSDSTTHFLLIHGSCPWTVTVVGRR